jgi:hypothetical protein
MNDSFAGGLASTQTKTKNEIFCEYIIACDGIHLKCLDSKQYFLGTFLKYYDVFVNVPTTPCIYIESSIETGFGVPEKPVQSYWNFVPQIRVSNACLDGASNSSFPLTV